MLLVDDALAPMVPSLREQCPQLTTVIHAGDGPTPDGLLPYEDLLAAATPVPDCRRGGDSLAGLFYTGGTTGFSKGVMLSHANLVTSAIGCTATGEFVSAGGTYLHAAPMFHAADQAGTLRRRARGRHPRHRPRVRPQGGARRHLGAPRHRQPCSCRR